MKLSRSALLLVYPVLPRISCNRIPNSTAVFMVSRCYNLFPAHLLVYVDSLRFRRTSLTGVPKCRIVHGRIRKVRKLVRQPRCHRRSASPRSPTSQKTDCTSGKSAVVFLFVPSPAANYSTHSFNIRFVRLDAPTQPTALHDFNTLQTNMRSPAVVFSLFAVSALSPSLVYGSPVPSTHTNAVVPNDVHHRASSVGARGLGFLNEVFARADSTNSGQHPAYTSKPKVASIAGVDLGYVSGWLGFLPVLICMQP